jgi:DNA-binding response OmpR family regulator
MNESILIVEDNHKLAGYIKQNLIEAGYQADIEPRGDKAVFTIINKQPDLVILDIMLPGLNGNEVCQTIRSDYKGKILMLTTLSDSQTEISSLNLGADDYMTKPFGSEMLLAHISALLRRPSLVESIQKIILGKLELNLISQSATFKGNDIELKPNEFELLALLAKNPDSILNRETISQALKGISYDGVDRSIDLRISYLRKKLDDNQEKPFRIKTIRSKGYVLLSDAWEK